MLLRSVFLILLALAVPAVAQIPGISKTTTQTVTETPDQTKARLGDWLKDARSSLARFDDPAAETQLPEGISPAALADRRRDLDQIFRTLNRTLTLLDQIPIAQQEVEEIQKANSDWAGFTEKPPYSLLKLDDLLNQRDATRQKLETFKSSIDIFSKSFDGIDNETKANGETIRSTQEVADKPDASEAAKWRLDAAKTKARLLTVRAFFVRSNIDLLEKQQAAANAQLALTERQIKIVQGNASLSDADLAAIQKSSDDRRAALREEMSKVRLRLKDASSARVRAKAAFDGLNESTGPARDLASSKLSAAEARVDSLDFISGNLESFESLEGYLPVAYQNRRTLLESKDAGERKAALENLHALLERLKAWETVTANELAAASADLARQDSNASVLPPDDARLPVIAEQRKALWEKQDFLQRVSQTILAQRKNLTRWIGEFEGNGKEQQWYSKVTESGRSLGGLITGIWNFELTKVDTVTYSAGVPRTETRSITLGIVLTALTLFIIAYGFAARISRRLQGVIVGRGHIAEAQANTLRTWLMILVTVALALTTLRYFEIPLTVFAFFGGALAIGLGFGTQTLIKNFISGIIVLFERKIRVGDILEVDANTSGTVVEINTRSSVLRNAEGKETLIPNSLFLENRVTNLTLSNRRVRRVIRLGVGHGCDPSQVMTILKECAERHGLILNEPAPVVTLDDITPGGLTFAVFFWVEFNSRTDSNVVSSDVRIMIGKRFAESGIEFQNSDVTLRSAAPLQLEMGTADIIPAVEERRSLP